LDELGVEYIEGYPASEYYINDRLKCIHGLKTGRRGSVAPKVVNDEYVSTITGHTHRIELVYKTTHTRTGARTNLAATLGCLSKIDGSVPSTKSSYDSSGHPIESYEDWQQCVGIVRFEDGDGIFSVTPVFISEGEAIYNGTIYQS
jgi:hypothetical protein